jgi:nucleoside-diphosphate-sugar epimerase
MTKILITGALGQIGTALTTALNNKFGQENVIISDIRDFTSTQNKYYQLDILNKVKLEEIIESEKITIVYHLAALLSATGEKDPFLCWDINMNGTLNILELGVKHKLFRIFIPSSIAVWGEGINRDNTEQDSVLRPATMYGVTKVAGEILANYFYNKYKLDIRGIRYPGIISSETLPGGGTTDYAVEIFYEAIKNKKYECFLSEDTMLPMMYMEDCIKATLDLMDAPVENLIHHADFNVGAISFTPKELALEIKKHIPEFEISYKPDYRQNIADSWPRSIDDSAARKEWNWNHSYDLEKMTSTMIKNLTPKLLG